VLITIECDINRVENSLELGKDLFWKSMVAMIVKVQDLDGAMCMSLYWGE